MRHAILALLALTHIKHRYMKKQHNQPTVEISGGNKNVMQILFEP